MKHILLTYEIYNDKMELIWQEGALDYTELLTDRAQVVRAAKFMHQTGLLALFNSAQRTDPSGTIRDGLFMTSLNG